MKRTCHISYNIINKISRFQDRSTSISLSDKYPRSSLLVSCSAFHHHVSLPQVPIRFLSGSIRFSSKQLAPRTSCGPAPWTKTGWHPVGIWLASGVHPVLHQGIQGTAFFSSAWAEVCWLVCWSALVYLQTLIQQKQNNQTLLVKISFYRIHR